jgi:predicted MFS family arabinose efflux permease
MIFWRFLQGVFTPGVFSVTVAYINEEWPVNRVGQAMAVFGTGGVIGGCVGRLLGGLIAEYFNWQWSFFVLGAINLVWAMALVKSLPRERLFVPAEPSNSLSYRFADHLRNRPLLATYGVGFCIFFSTLALFTYVNFHLAVPPYGLSTAALGYLFLVYLFGAVITPLAGRWIDKLGHLKAYVTAALAGIMGLVFTLHSSLRVIVFGLALYSAAAFIAQASCNSHIGRVVEHSQALAAGMYATSYYVGGAMGSIVPAWLWSMGGWTTCVSLIVAVQVASVTMALSFWSPRGTPNSLPELR